MIADKKNTKLTPFLKWAGGKRWFAERYLNTLPKFTGNYIEPFLGSAAVFFALAPKTALLGDTNGELIETYRAVKRCPLEVEKNLHTHALNHCGDYYYEVRGDIPKTAAERAARFIYLNRTCWNGLYRVNRLGKFNVPRGTKETVILASDDFPGWARVLRNTRLVCSDFDATIDQANFGDLLFVDPPYTVSHNNNGFIKYNQKIFSWSDQERLAHSLIRASERGAKVVSTNAAHSEVERLYRDFFKITRLSRASVIAGSAKFRGTFSELLITN